MVIELKKVLLPCRFQEILPISAKTNGESVNRLKEALRRLIDVNEDIKREEIEAQIKATK